MGFYHWVLRGMPGLSPARSRELGNNSNKDASVPLDLARWKSLWRLSGQQAAKNLVSKILLMHHQGSSRRACTRSHSCLRSTPSFTNLTADRHDANDFDNITLNWMSLNRRPCTQMLKLPVHVIMRPPLMNKAMAGLSHTSSRNLHELRQYLCVLCAAPHTFARLP